MVLHSVFSPPRTSHARRDCAGGQGLRLRRQSISPARGETAVRHIQPTIAGSPFSRQIARVLRAIFPEKKSSFAVQRAAKNRARHGGLDGSSSAMALEGSACLLGHWRHSNLSRSRDFLFVAAATIDISGRMAGKLLAPHRPTRASPKSEVAQPEADVVPQPPPTRLPSARAHRPAPAAPPFPSSQPDGHHEALPRR